MPTTHTHAHTCTLTHTYMPLREKNNISIKAFSGACTNKICPFDQSSEYDEYVQWICQLGAFWLSNKLLAKLEKSHNILKLHLLHGKKTCFHFALRRLKTGTFQRTNRPDFGYKRWTNLEEATTINKLNNVKNEITCATLTNCHHLYYTDKGQKVHAPYWKRAK